MKSSAKRIYGKLNDSRGDSIAEVLVALLIAAVALVMLASMIASSSSMIIRSRGYMTDYYDQNNDLIDNAANQHDGTVTVKASDGTSPYGITENGETLNVKYTVNDSYKGGRIVSYRGEVS